MLLPENSENFKTIVLEKIRTYCDTGIWPFEFEKFAAWLHNFDCKIEEYLALQILDSLIVRSKEMAKASYTRLLYGPVRQNLIEHTSIKIGHIQDWKKQLKYAHLCSDIRFAPVRLKDDQGESGSVIYRMLSDVIDTNRHSFSKAGQKSPSAIILVDDFIGSGDQFIEFSTQFELTHRLKTTKILYCPLIGFEDGLTRIKDTYPELVIIPGENMYKSDGLFNGSDDDFFKNDNQNTIGNVKDFLDQMHKKYSPKMKNWLGYNKSGLPLSFEWGCPSQAPSILYMEYSSKRKSWNRLFNRRA